MAVVAILMGEGENNERRASAILSFALYATQIMPSGVSGYRTNEKGVIERDEKERIVNERASKQERKRELKMLW